MGECNGKDFVDYESVRVKREDTLMHSENDLRKHFIYWHMGSEHCRSIRGHEFMKIEHLLRTRVFFFARVDV